MDGKTGVNTHINTLWFGDSLGYLERLSIQSALAAGHQLTIWSYTPAVLRGVPAGVPVRDAREVMSDPRRTKHFDGKFKALGSDFFRYEIFHHQLGYWMDLDVIVLRKFDFATPHVYGWERPGSINGAVLRIPHDSPVLAELRGIPERNWRPPFFGPRRTLNYYLARLRGNVELEDMPWGVAGPEAITYYARKHDRLSEAQPVPVFYPVPYQAAEALFDDASVVEAMLSKETAAIHMWNSRINRFAKEPPPAGSYIAKMCARFGVEI
jgi:hypothetical protein